MLLRPTIIVAVLVGAAVGDVSLGAPKKGDKATHGDATNNDPKAKGDMTVPVTIKPVPSAFVPFEFTPGRRDPFISPDAASVYVTDKPTPTRQVSATFDSLFPLMESLILNSGLQLLGVSSSGTVGGAAYAIFDLTGWSPPEAPSEDPKADQDVTTPKPIRPSPADKPAANKTSNAQIRVVSKEEGLALSFPESTVKRIEFFSRLLQSKNSEPLGRTSSGEIVFPIRVIDETGVVIGFPNIMSPYIRIPLADGGAGAGLEQYLH